MRRMLSFLAISALALFVGCEGGGEGGGLDQETVDRAAANGNAVIWVESTSDFWDVREVRIAATHLGSDAGTYEVAPGSYTLSVTCRNERWKDQWTRMHDAADYTQSVHVDAVAGQVAHVLVDSTGIGNQFDLYVAQ